MARQKKSKTVYDTPEFKKLKSVWDKKLARSVFVDAEHQNTGNNKPVGLKRYDSYVSMLKHDPVDIGIKTLYYQLATTFLNDHAWDNPIHKQIWAYHADGVSVRDIAKKIKKRKISKSLVADIIKFYKGKVL